MHCVVFIRELVFARESFLILLLNAYAQIRRKHTFFCLNLEQIEYKVVNILTVGM